MIKIGLLGAGRIGHVHASSIERLDGVTLAAVADAIPDHAQRIATPAGAQVMDPVDLINCTQVDAVLIASPTDTHYDLIHAAAKARKAIFCEKPVDMSAERIRDCIRVVEHAQIPFMTAFNRRFDPNFATLKASIDAGDIGAVEIITIQSRDPSPPPISYIQSSGGLFRDMMIHDLDMARFLLGEEPDTIYAVGASLVDPEIGAVGDVDTAAVTLSTPSGKICQISNSRRASYGYDQRLEVHGANGMLRAENMLENSVELANADGFRKPPAQHFFLERYADAYRAEIAHFIAALNDGTTPNPDIHDGLRAQILADAATQSLKTGQAVTFS